MSQTDINAQDQKPKTCKLAIASLLIPTVYFGGYFISNLDVLSDPYLDSYDIIMFFGGCSILWILGFVLSAVALKKIKNSSGLLRGRSFATAGVVVSSLQLILFGIALMNSLAYIHMPRDLARKMTCGTNLNGLGKSMKIYANDYDDKYPTAEKWCDLLLMYIAENPRNFVCKGSDAAGGESSYAFNENLIDKRLTEVQPDVVVLFETNFGKGPSGRQERLGNRVWYESVKEYLPYWSKQNPPSKKVYKFRWSQYGGREILTTENHKGKGCNVLFNDGRVEFIETERLGELKWNVEGNE